MAPPDSVRLDFFADGGLGGGFAILIGDTIFTAADDEARRYLPSVPMLWAALGRLTVTSADTTARIDGDTLRADFGAQPTWRAAFARDQLSLLGRIEGGRLRESVRRDSTSVRYLNLGSRRRLTMTLMRHLSDSPYDQAIWHR